METNSAILELRKHLNLSQNEFAEKLLVTRQAVSRWENGDTIPNTDTLKLISKTFDVSADYLLGHSAGQCRSCGMILIKNSDEGTGNDGRKSEDYHAFGYRQEQPAQDLTAEGLTEHNLQDLDSRKQEAGLQKFLPTLKLACVVISVADINAARKFYEDLFGLEVFQDYGRNIVFTCGLALQQDFDWLVNLPKEKVLKKSNNAEIVFEEQAFDSFLDRLKKRPDIECLGEVAEYGWGQRVVRFYDLDGHIIEVGEDMKMVLRRFLASGMTVEEVSVKMDASVEDLMKFLESWHTVDE